MPLQKIALAVMGAILMSVPASAGAVPPFVGNDTGGIIAWSPEADHFRHDIAGEHCIRYGKIHHITSRPRRYGQYIGFACFWPRGHNPAQVIVRSAY